MKSRSKLSVFFGLLIIASMVLGSCTTPTAAPETLRETVVVTQMVAGTPQTVVITATPGPVDTADTPPSTSFLPADGLVQCLPLPPEALITNEASAEPGTAHTASQAQLEKTAKDANTGFYGQPSAGDQQSGKIYRIGVFEDVTSLNYWAANGPDNTVWNSYMLPMRITPYALSEVNFTLIPNAAAATTPDPLKQEGDYWVTNIPIRKDIKWSDGEPLTAKDVAFTLNTALRFDLIGGNWSGWADKNFLDHTEVVDEYTVKYVYHTKPGIARHEYGALQVPIMAEHFWGPKVDEAAAPIDALAADATDEAKATAYTAAQDNLYAIAPDGEPLAGTFLLQKWEQGAFIDSPANMNYYLKGLQMQQWANGAYKDSDGVTVGEPEGDPIYNAEIGPFVDAVVYTVYGSQDAAIMALRQGEVDFMLNSLGLQRGLANQIQNDPQLKVIENRVNGFRYLGFNMRRRPMNDCSFRQAVALLIDKEFVANNILQGVATPFYSFVAPGNTAWYNPDAPKLGMGMTRPQRLAAAIKVLEQAGFTWEGGNKPTYDESGKAVVPGGSLIMPDGTPVPQIELWAPSAGYDPLRSTFAIWVETWLNEVGIPVKAHLVGFNILQARIFTEQDFDMYILGWSLSFFPASLRDFFSKEQAVLDGNNAVGYMSDEFETLSMGLLTCDTIVGCKDIADKLQTLLSTELPYVVLFDTGIIEAYRSASVEMPFEVQLSGLQYTHQGGYTQAEVHVK